MSDLRHFRYTMVVRRFGVPVASARWLPEAYDPDKSTWLPVFRRLGVTETHARRRAVRAADRHFATTGRAAL